MDLRIGTAGFAAFELSIPVSSEDKELNTIFLLPQDSEFLDIEIDSEYVTVTFDNKSMRLLRSDVLLLPLTNITIELLSGYLLERLLENNAWLKECAMTKLAIAVANTDKQSATAEFFFAGCIALYFLGIKTYLLLSH